MKLMMKYMSNMLLILLLSLTPVLASEWQIKEHNIRNDSQSHLYSIRQCLLGNSVVITSGYCSGKMFSRKGYNQLGGRMDSILMRKAAFLSQDFAVYKNPRLDAFLDCDGKGYCPVDKIKDKINTKATGTVELVVAD